MNDQSNASGGILNSLVKKKQEQSEIEKCVDEVVALAIRWYRRFIEIAGSMSKDDLTNFRFAHGNSDVAVAVSSNFADPGAIVAELFPVYQVKDSELVDSSACIKCVFSLCVGNSRNKIICLRTPNKKPRKMVRDGNHRYFSRWSGDIETIGKHIDELKAVRDWLKEELK